MSYTFFLKRIYYILLFTHITILNILNNNRILPFKVIIVLFSILIYLILMIKGKDFIQNKIRFPTKKRYTSFILLKNIFKTYVYAMNFKYFPKHEMKIATVCRAQTNS